MKLQNKFTTYAVGNDNLIAKEYFVKEMVFK